jgi:hypothetical protein
MHKNKSVKQKSNENRRLIVPLLVLGGYAPNRPSAEIGRVCHLIGIGRD